MLSGIGAVYHERPLRYGISALDMALSGGISAEIFSIQDYFCINIIQRSPDRKYFDRMTDILRELSIPFTILEPDHFEICRFQV